MTETNPYPVSKNDVVHRIKKNNIQPLILILRRLTDLKPQKKFLITYHKKVCQLNEHVFELGKLQTKILQFRPDPI